MLEASFGDVQGALIVHAMEGLRHRRPITIETGKVKDHGALTEKLVDTCRIEKITPNRVVLTFHVFERASGGVCLQERDRTMAFLDR